MNKIITESSDYEKFKAAPMTEAYNAKETVDLEYDDLEIEIVTRRGNPGGYYSPSFGNWLPDDDETKEITIDYTYSVDRHDVEIYIIEDCLCEEDYSDIDNAESHELEEFVSSNFDNLFDKYYEEILSYFRDDAQEHAEANFDADDYFGESLDMDKDYEYAGYENGFDIYRKVVNGKGVWAAKKSGDADAKMLPITYNQALGREPIEPDKYGIDRLAKRLGKVFLGDNEPLDETWVKMDTIDYSIVKELNDFLKSRDCDHRADIARRNGVDCIYFDIVWGDWKHDHMRVWYLVNEFFRDRGYIIERDIVTTETNGTDSYSAEHYFEIMKDDEEFVVDDEMDSPIYLDLLNKNKKMNESCEKNTLKAHTKNSVWMLYHCIK